MAAVGVRVHKGRKAVGVAGVYGPFDQNARVIMAEELLEKIEDQQNHHLPPLLRDCAELHKPGETVLRCGARFEQPLILPSGMSCPTVRHAWKRKQSHPQAVVIHDKTENYGRNCQNRPINVYLFCLQIFIQNKDVFPSLEGLVIIYLLAGGVFTGGWGRRCKQRA